MTSRRAFVPGGLVLVLVSAGPAVAGTTFDWRWNAVDQACDGDCSFTIYGGRHVDTAMTDIFLTEFVPPWDWRYGDSGIVAATVGRRVARLFDRVDLEPEIGVAQRFGDQTETEVWMALYARWTEFPWNDYVRTTVGISTGLNYASGISEVERERAQNDGKGSRLLHFLAPEITFAMPDHPDTELVFRFHHRSGIYGLIDGVDGGAQYATVGLRFRW